MEVYTELYFIVEMWLYIDRLVQERRNSSALFTKVTMYFSDFKLIIF